MSIYTDVYDFDVYYKKMGEYFDKSPFQIYGSYKSISSSAWASHVGTNRVEAQDEYIDAVSRAIPHASRVLNGLYTGFDDLVRGELCFFRREYVSAEKYLKQSFDKAQARGQYVTQNRALVYLMQIAFFRGDFASAGNILQTMEAMLNEKDYGIRYTMYDITCGFYYLALDQPNQVPEWLKENFSSYAHPSFIENYANRVKAQYHYQTQQYGALLSFLENTLTQQKQTILFNSIGLRVLQALSLYQLRQPGAAIAALTEAYHLAESNRIIVIFTQYAKDMRTLTAAALKDDTCQIPRTWLETINRKASSIAKRKAHMISKYMTANRIEDEITLTKRETEVLKDLVQGLSRAEIAASQNISVNTVKMIITIIYEKLHATSLPDAIRIALDCKLV